MSARRLCTVIAALVVITACGDSAATDAETSVANAPPIVQLGPMPSRPRAPTVVEPSSTPPVSPRANTIPATSSAATRTSTTVRSAPTKTACTKVAYIGDSVSIGMSASATLTISSVRLETRMAEIGVTDLRVEISGGRSIVETLSGQENAVDVALRLRDTGFSGCWVIAIGTNDAANIAAGGPRQAGERIVSMMSVIGTDRVLWIDAATVATSGFWASPNVVAWNSALTAAARSYRNLRIAPWSRLVESDWFVPDGVHLTTAGVARRVDFVATALVATYPST